MEQQALARALWQVVEPFHALTYFAPEARQAYEHAGLHGFWRGYFAGRSAPMGAVGPGPVTAGFYGFAPDFVARALPDVWARITPQTAVEARLAGVDAAVRRIWDGGEDEDDGDQSPQGDWASIARLLRHAMDGCSPAGRPLFAANMSLSWPDEPHLAVWHGATLLREHRRDGHVAALLTAGLDPCEAHVTQAASAGTSLETLKPYRGWSDDDWAAAADRLRDRRLLTDDGRLTDAGRELRLKIEAETDRLAAEPVANLEPQAIRDLIELLGPIARRLATTATIPYPNPIGVPPPD